MIFLYLMFGLGLGSGICLAGLIFYTWEVKELKKIRKESDKLEQEFNQFMKDVGREGNGG